MMGEAIFDFFFFFFFFFWYQLATKNDLWRFLSSAWFKVPFNDVKTPVPFKLRTSTGFFFSSLWNSCNAWVRWVWDCLKPLYFYFDPLIFCIAHIIHPIHRFKSCDWLKEGHMTWIIFDNVRVWKLIHVCYCLLFPWFSKKLSQLPNWELGSLLSRFYDSVRTKKSMNGVYKTNIDCSFMGEWYKIIVPSVKFNLGLLFTSVLRASVNSRPRLNFTLVTIIFHHSLHEQSIFVY